jgi:hypothetical protein
VVERLCLCSRLIFSSRRFDPIGYARVRYLFSVAQIFNLPYRRFVIGKLPVTPRPLDFADDPQVTILRYSRLQVCATGVRNAENRYRIRTRARDWAHLESCRHRNACKGTVIRSYQPVVNRLLSCFSLRRRYGVPPLGGPGRLKPELQTGGPWRAPTTLMPCIGAMNRLSNDE